MGLDNVILTGDFNSNNDCFANKTRDPGGILLREITDYMNLAVTNDNTPTRTNDTTNDKDILDLMFISPPINHHFRGFWVGEELRSGHNTISGVLPQTPIIDELPTKTVVLYHKADWKDINQITNTMTNHTLDIHTATIQDIDNYVNTLADTITQTIDVRVQSKTLKPNSVGLPQAIRDLIKEKRRQRRYWQQTNYN